VKNNCPTFESHEMVHKEIIFVLESKDSEKLTRWKQNSVSQEKAKYRGMGE
jgi:hypothetical protein